MADNQRANGHYQLYSHPNKEIPIEYDKTRYKKLAFVASNDFAGNINPTNYPIENRFKEPRVLRIGGVSAARAYLDIFEKKYKDSLVYVDSGSFLHESHNHKHTFFLYNYLGLDVASLGANELKIQSNISSQFVPYLESLTRNNRFGIVSSNLFDLKTTEQIKWRGVSEYYIKKINGVNIGFIGVLTPDVSEQIPDKQINGLYIQKPSKSIIVKAQRLRRKGAQVIVLLANKGMDCSSQLAQEEEVSSYKVNFNPKKSSHCDTKNSQLYKTLQTLPANTIDLVFTSGEKSKVANYIFNYPVSQNPGDGKYLSWVEVYFDMKHNAIDKSKTKIHQPVQLCHSFLKESMDCFTQEGIYDEELVPAMFFGHKVVIKDLPKFN
jgi:2',3'-cyclic-nucleotide 2'-phosphodiesterase (5'-nucleotidase family)